MCAGEYEMAMGGMTCDKTNGKKDRGDEPNKSPTDLVGRVSTSYWTATATEQKQGTRHSYTIDLVMVPQSWCKLKVQTRWTMNEDILCHPTIGLDWIFWSVEINICSARSRAGGFSTNEGMVPCTAARRLNDISAAVNYVASVSWYHHFCVFSLHLFESQSLLKNKHWVFTCVILGKNSFKPSKKNNRRPRNCQASHLQAQLPDELVYALRFSSGHHSNTTRNHGTTWILG